MLPPAAINEGPPVVPRPSATVLLVRDGDPWELLMVQRPGGADFAPGAYVFPGGTVIEDDRSFDDELRAAAVRELFEEAGILLANDANERDMAAVRRLVETGASFGDAVSQAALTLDFDSLVMFARWVTPAILRRRFDARFYLARMPEGQVVRPQEGEIVDWRWVSPARALIDSELTLVYATRAVLESVADAPGVDELFARARAMKEVPVVEPRLVQTAAGWEVVRDSAFEEWRARRRAGDPTATLIELYALVARPRGLEPWELPLSERLALSARALPEMFPGFELVPDSGRGPDPITLEPYDPTWPRRFEEWKQKLIEALPSRPRRIDHVGSTAVPGLLGKDCVDVQISVDDIRDEPGYAPAIESLGVQLRSRDDLHRYFRPFAGRPRVVHVHVCDAGSEWERRHLLFVAYLRKDRAARESYAQAKLAAVARWADDRAAYTEAKDSAIREIEARAEEWARFTRWTPDSRD